MSRAAQITRAHAKRLNALQKVYGPPGPLTLLKFEGRDAPTPYRSLKVYEQGESVNGWGADTAKDTSADFVTVQIADVDGELGPLVEPSAEKATHFAQSSRAFTSGTLASLEERPSGEATHFALGEVVYKLESDQTRKPVQASHVWTLRGFVTADTYP